MNSLKKLSELADRFEQKLNKIAQVSVTDQPSTTTLFFGEGNDQQKFSSMVQDPTGPIAKFLTDAATKSQKSTSFDLKINAEPKKGASWILTVMPSSLRSSVAKLLDVEFQKLRRNSMSAQVSLADKSAKAGGGTGTNSVASLNIDMD